MNRNKRIANNVALLALMGLICLAGPGFWVFALYAGVWGVIIVNLKKRPVFRDRDQGELGLMGHATLYPIAVSVWLGVMAFGLNNFVPLMWDVEPHQIDWMSVFLLYSAVAVMAALPWVPYLLRLAIDKLFDRFASSTDLEAA